jgi:hypothetical protein
VGVKKSGRRARARQVEDRSYISTFTGSARIPRASLLAGASVLALGAFAAPDRALATCSGTNQRISTPTTGPVVSDGGAIAVTTTGIVTGLRGATGLAGIDVTVCPATTLTNRGAIGGGAGESSSGNGVGGAGVSNSGAIKTLINSSAISGGAATVGFTGIAAGGAGVSNAGAITTLTNSGTIAGGMGAGSDNNVAGGTGVFNGTGATISNLSNNVGGTISGAGLLENGVATVAGGAAVSNLGMITKLVNRGAITGGGGKFSGNVAGGAALSNVGTITTLTNKGAITGGGSSSFEASGFATGAAAVSNSGTIKTLTNSGTISGGAAFEPSGEDTQGDAIYSAGANASIGTIANTGSIVGKVEIDSQSNVTITGGSGQSFGHLTPGQEFEFGRYTIVIGNGNLTFGGGNTFLADDVMVNGGLGTLTNMGSLRIGARHPITVAGNFDQTSAGALAFAVRSDTAGQYGALTVTSLSLATLDGRLAIVLTDGFTLATGDSFDILNFGGLNGDFSALSLDHISCSGSAADSWTCGGGVHLTEMIGATSLDLVVAQAPAPFGPAGSSPIPEPSTWAMLALGFLGLGRLGLRKRAPPS